MDELKEADVLLSLCVIGTWSLVLAQKDGRFMKAGQYGLYWGKGNDIARYHYKNPVIVWNKRPVRDTKENQKEFIEGVHDFYENFTCHPDEGWDLVEAAKEEGFSEEDILEEWLFDYLAKWMEIHELYSWKTL